jgi:MEDS: MEthanogen/methylotroph, DcmR Sensory domain
MTALASSAADLPGGSHSVALFASPPEAARHVAGFLRGARDLGQPAIVVTSEEEQLRDYQDAVRAVAPEMERVFELVPGPHTRPTPDGFRPSDAITRFAADHPTGASMCGDTIPRYLDRGNLAAYLRYEAWLDTLRPYPHRALCPYDLTRIPLERAAEALDRLARTHSHALLSDDPNPGVRLLQLLVVPHLDTAPEDQRVYLRRAMAARLFATRGTGKRLGLTLRGEQLVRALVGLQL